MTQFLKYVSRARSRINKALGEDAPLRQEAIDQEHLPSTTDPLQTFQADFELWWNELFEAEQSVLRTFFSSAEFEHLLADADHRIESMTEALNQAIPQFSPLHPAYPLLNVFHDVHAQCGSLDDIDRAILEIIEPIIGSQ